MAECSLSILRSLPIVFKVHINPSTKGLNMKHSNYLLAFIATFTFTLFAEAKEIYESTDKTGGTEFTDQPSAGAEVVNIQEPNIADAVDSPKPTQDKPETKKATKQSEPAEPEISYRNIAGDDDKNPKRVHREQQRQERRNKRQDNRENSKKSAGHSAVKGR
ncbi:hypothetical protein A9Q88_05935 [Gammaproteobacteria bacterium 50_400_T64]|nr:hypothetical protein A9Q88_05935 [Gammaproteobacteria bacterium 50_400_T64]